VPKGVKVAMPLQAYFRINAEKAGQFERTLIIADEGADVTYIEGCLLKGTEITTRNGTMPIEKVAVGDLVLTHKGRLKKVYHTQVRPYTGKLYTIEYDNGKFARIKTTNEHPFLVIKNETENQKDWVRTENLTVGTCLAAPIGLRETIFEKSGNMMLLANHVESDVKYSPVAIKKITYETVENIPVYNFSVEEDESYIAAGVAVHNCTAPIYISASLHSAVVELVAHKDAHIRYVTIQNWSKNVYNLVTQRAFAYEGAHVEWIDGNIGSRVNMKYPSVYLKGRGAKGEILSIAIAGEGQTQDSGGKIYHLAPDTSSKIVSKSVSKGSGSAAYRGLLHIAKEASGVKSNVRCVKPDMVILGDNKPISQYSSGEHVIGERGLTTVRDTFANDFDGELIRIQAVGLFPIEATPEHPVLSSKSNVVYPCVYRNGEHKHTARINLGRPSWKMASELKEKVSNRDGDYLLVPRHTGTISMRTLDLSEFIANERGHRTMLSKRFSTTFPLNQDTAWLLGLYVAEGSSAQGKMRFSLGQAETHLQRRVARIFKELGYRTTLQKIKNEKAIDVISFSTVISRAFVEWCGKRAPNKMIPEFVLLHKDKEILGSFLDGYLSGDGCVTANCMGNRNIIHAVTTSKLLATQLQLLGARLGLFFRITKASKADSIMGRKVNVHEKYDIRCNTGTKQQARFDDDYMYVPIRKIDSVVYKGPVCNIETANHTYLISNAISHNCDALLLDEHSRTATYPYMQVYREDAVITHEATVGKIGSEQLFYMMSRGMTEDDAVATIVLGFIEDLAKVLPMEYSIELKRLIKLDTSGSVG
jgi:Fe-S cluster assembly scaffold protein SufB